MATSFPFHQWNDFLVTKTKLISRKQINFFSTSKIPISLSPQHNKNPPHSPPFFLHPLCFFKILFSMATTNAAAVVHSATTTFVEADPSTFRAIVQKLTGAPNRPPAAFRLQERRRSSKKLELELNGGYTAAGGRGTGIGMVSPVSTLDFMERGNPCEEEERAIAEKGFYLHPSPISTPGGSDPPHLLPLFPLSSPSNCNNRNHSVSS